MCLFFISIQQNNYHYFSLKFDAIMLIAHFKQIYWFLLKTVYNWSNKILIKNEDRTACTFFFSQLSQIKISKKIISICCGLKCMVNCK